MRYTNVRFTYFITYLGVSEGILFERAMVVFSYRPKLSIVTTLVIYVWDKKLLETVLALL